MRPQVLFPLFAPVTALRGVGPKLAPLLEKVAGPQVRDLAFLAPTGVIDRPVVRIAEAVDGAVQTFVVTVDQHQPGAGRTPYRVRVADETGFLHLVWFGHRGPSLAQAHPVGAVRAVSGKVESFGSERQVAHPDWFVAPERAGDIPRHEPVYPATAASPAASAISLSARTAPLSRPVSRIPRTPAASSGPLNVSKCWRPRISVGAIRADCRPLSAASAMASMATAVLPLPTSPCTSRVIRSPLARSPPISATVRR